MSYFGNIENGNKTNLTFDKVYPNRYQMDRGASTDGVFIGRYVFIEYDDNTFPYRFGYMNNNISETGKNVIYADSEYKFPYKYTEPTEEGYGLDYIEVEDIIIVDLDDYPNLKGVIDVVYNPLLTSLCYEAKQRNICFLNCEGG